MRSTDNRPGASDSRLLGRHGRETRDVLRRAAKAGAFQQMAARSKLQSAAAIGGEIVGPFCRTTARSSRPSLRARSSGWIGHRKNLGWRALSRSARKLRFRPTGTGRSSYGCPCLFRIAAGDRACAGVGAGRGRVGQAGCACALARLMIGGIGRIGGKVTSRPAACSAATKSL